MTRGFAFWVVCRLLGLVILLAGIAKAYELLAYQRISTLYAVAGSLEMVFGLWVVCSNRSRLTWWLLVGCFTTFMGVSFYQAISGQTSCGCFGTLHIAPWFTFSFDLGALGVLWCYRSVEPTFARSHEIARFCRICGGVLPIFAIGGILFAVYVLRDRPATLGADGEIHGQSRTVIVDVKEWVGQSWPLLPNINIAARLSAGTWIVLLVRTDCSVCQRQIPGFLDAIDRARPELQTPKTVLLTVPEQRAIATSMKDVIPKADGSLRHDIRWVVPTPLFLKLQEGVVLWVTDEVENAMQFLGIEATEQ